MATIPNLNEILKLIVAKRKEIGYSQEYLGHILNVSSSAYGKIERGETILSLDRVIIISQLLNITREVTDLIFKSESDYSKLIAPKTTITNLSIDEESHLAKCIIRLYESYVSAYIVTTHHDIMSDYPYTEFTARDWWNAMGEGAEKEMGMSEEEFFDLYDGGYSPIYTKEHEQEGFERLMSKPYCREFFKYGLFWDSYLGPQFEEYKKRQPTSLGDNPDIRPELIRSYIEPIVRDDTYLMRSPNSSRV